MNDIQRIQGMAEMITLLCERSTKLETELQLTKAKFDTVSAELEKAREHPPEYQDDI